MVWDQSRTARVLRAVSAAVARASEGSTLRAAAESLATSAQTAVRNSYCYRWLTAEPEPDVVVIDLRETRTVGPFVRLLERVVDPVERAWADSRLASVTAGVGAALSGSRTGQLLAALLEPPESENDRETE
jgi:hypothetical protein